MLGNPEIGNWISFPAQQPACLFRSSLRPSACVHQCICASCPPNSCTTSLLLSVCSPELWEVHSVQFLLFCNHISYSWTVTMVQAGAPAKSYSCVSVSLMEGFGFWIKLETRAGLFSGFIGAHTFTASSCQLQLTSLILQQNLHGCRELMSDQSKRIWAVVTNTKIIYWTN